MFQLWKLVLLCGLLAGTSASLLDNLGKDVLRKLKTGLEQGLDNLDSTLQTIFQQLKTDFALPQESNTAEAQENTEETKNLLEQLISGIFQVVYRLTGVKISNLHILDLTLEATSDSSADMKIPITADVNVKLPVLGEIVDLALDLVLQFHVSVETDEDTDVYKVVVEECSNDQHSISLTMLGRSGLYQFSLFSKHIELLNEVLKLVTNLVNEVLSLVTEYEVCPLVRSLLESLDADYVKNHIGEAGLQMFAELGVDSLQVTMKNTSYTSIWNYPYFVLATFTLGQGYRSLLRCMWLNEGD
ncbi:short palate, lung and nasal epithelium carcinoma-associated protein 2B-like [Ovis canadensis]|uniref:short palate, lung and nasal epithelium carcinoma-associated protein 2B-like n=1 Tax=Ovis canadensis TaxID=37174 RepID=UPI00374FE21C